MGAPLHSLLIMGPDISDMEAQMFMLWTDENDTARAQLAKYLL